MIVMTVMLNKAKLTPIENDHTNKDAYITARVKHAVYLQGHMLLKIFTFAQSLFFYTEHLVFCQMNCRIVAVPPIKMTFKDMTQKSQSYT